LTALAVALETGDRYVAAAYVVFVALIVVYVAIMAAKLTRIQRTLETLRDDRGEPEQ
jgi:type II secretory pathway component PulM